MDVIGQKTMTGKILDNILFLAEVFGDGADQDIPRVPVLEMAKCFNLTPPPPSTTRRRPRDWRLWK